MLRKSNKKLYESIMKDVSKTVKKRLNEMINNSSSIEDLPDYENMDAEELFFQEWRSNGIIRHAIEYAIENLDKWDPNEMWFGVEDPENPENKCVYTKEEAERVLWRADECLEY